MGEIMQRTIKGAALAAALLLVAAVEARAADSFDWTGVYVGVNAGAAYAHERWNFSQIGTDANSNVWSGVAGGTLGWNFVQTGPWVFGVEGDYDWADLHSHTSCPNPAYNCTVNVTNLATARVRAGYAVRDRWLVFATAGVAGGTVQPAAPVVAPGTAAPLASVTRPEMDAVAAWPWRCGGTTAHKQKTIAISRTSRFFRPNIFKTPLA